MHGARRAAISESDCPNLTRKSVMDNGLAKLALGLGILYAAYRWGPPVVKSLAVGAAGFMVANNVPIVQDVLTARVVKPAAAAA
jgi:hypothetical protein